MLPRSELDSLNDAQVQQVQTDLSTELFGFAPTSFTARVVDVANEVIYDVIDKIEVECMRRWVGEEQDAPVDDSRKQTVQKVRFDLHNSDTRSALTNFPPVGSQSPGDAAHGRRRPSLRSG